jgi:methylmalonyl-CoA/ethylmalonyl-CoA epimerase
MPDILGVDHLAIAVEDLDEATSSWRDRLGLRVGSRAVVEDQGVEVQMMYAGETRIELVCPIRPDSPISSFLAKRGPGLHHLALAVADCAASIEQVASAGGRMIDTAPCQGAHQTQIAFVHPHSTGGVLAELVEGGEGPWQDGSDPTSSSQA